VGVDAFEINFSCPHGLPERKMGMAMGQDCDVLGEVCGWINAKASVPVWGKMTPNITDITQPALVAVQQGARISAGLLDGWMATVIALQLRCCWLGLADQQMCLMVTNGAAFGGCHVVPILARTTSTTDIDRHGSCALCVSAAGAVWSMCMREVLLHVGCSPC
jgi:hypothetical protein